MNKIVLILLLFPFIGKTQEIDSDTIFLDSHWNITTYRSLAKFYRETDEPNQDSIITVRDYFLENGKIQMIGTYHGTMKRSNQTGEFKYFYSNGNIKAIYQYNGGLVDGELKKYYTNGSIKSIEHYDLGIQIDTLISFFENGQLRKIEVLNPSFSTKSSAEKYMRFFLLEAYTTEGKQVISEGTGTYTEYFLSGKKRTQIEYKNGLPHGKWINYKGQKNKASCIMTFKDGKFIKGELYDNGKKDIFSTLSRKAYFPTGLRGLDKFILLNTGECPKSDDSEFVAMISVTTEGNVYFEQIILGNASACQLEEIQMLIKNMPLWVPAISNGKYVEANQAIRIGY